MPDGLASLVEELVDEYKKVQWLGNVDTKIAAVLMTAKGKETRVAIRDDMGKSLSVLCVKLATILGKENAPTVREKVDELFPELVTSWPTESTPAIAGSDEPAAVLPKIITFDEKSVPGIEQEVRETVTKNA